MNKLNLKKTYTYHTDPGHGWMAVKRDELIILGIDHLISTYSYQSPSGQTIYLEEDCDADLFLKTYQEKFGPEVRIRGRIKETHVNSNHRIRDLGVYDKKHPNISIKQQLVLRFDLPEDSFHTYCSDQYVLWSVEVEQWLNDRELSFIVRVSNVEGNSWYGEKFIDIPFAHSN